MSPEETAAATETEESVATTEEESSEQTTEEEAEASGATREAEEAGKAKSESETGNEGGKKKLSGWQKKVNRLTKRASSAEEALEIERRETAKLRAQIDGKPAAAKTADDDPEPKEEDFKTYKEFTKAMGLWAGRQTYREQHAKAQTTEAQEAEAERQETTYAEHLDRIETAKETYEDWDDVTEALNGKETIPPAAGIAIVEADNGPDVMYYLATHPEELQKLSEMPPMKAAMKIGALSEKLLATKPASKPATRRVSKAPPPITPVGGGSAKAGVVDLSKAPLTDYMKVRRAK